VFEFIQAISIDASAKQAFGRAYVPAESPQFADHFPGRIVLPGTTGLELGAQVAGPLVETTATERGPHRLAMLAMVERSVFRVPIPLPAEIRITARIERELGSSIRVGVVLEQGEERAATARLVMQLIDVPQGQFGPALAARSRRLERWKSAWS